MRVDDLLRMDRVKELIESGYLRERSHPLYPQLRTLGYTEKSQWERVWTPETETCRGLIYDNDTRMVLARPFRKFFNYSEMKEKVDGLPLNEPVLVSDKMDGSLGILFVNPYSERIEVATRGSFDSDQARWATEWLQRELANPESPWYGWSSPCGATCLAEIIVPWNRIVCDYKDREDLVYLGCVGIDTGTETGPGQFGVAVVRWPGSVTEVMEYDELSTALLAPPRAGAEGLVVQVLNQPQIGKIKLKQEDYVRLHKIITGLSDKAVWEHLSGGGSIEELFADVPDEFHEWLDTTAAALWDKYDSLYGEAQDVFIRICSQMAGEETEDLELLQRAELGLKAARADKEGRKDFAIRLNKYAAGNGPDKSLVFGLLDDKDISIAIWKKLRPVGVRYVVSGGMDENGEVA